MPDGTVDNLNIQVSADADQASKSLNSLVSTLNSVDREFSKNISGLRKFSKEIGVLSSSLKTLSGIKISSPDLSGMTKLIDTLNKFDAGKAKSAADGIESVAKSFGDLSKTNFNDSGINKTLRAVNKLFRADFGKFNPDDFQKITNSISALGNMPDVSSSVNRFVSSLSRLANAGEKTGQSANEVLRLGEQTRLAARKLKSVGGINEDVNLFVQSIGRLASAGAKTSQTASGLNSLAKETLEFFKAMQNAPKVSENTIRMTQALAQLASAGGKVGTSTNTITSAFNKLSSVGSKTMSVMRKVASGITSAFKQIGNSSSGLTKAQFSLVNLLKTAIGFQLGYGLLNFGKQAFELGSAITEVENVVDVAFGDMADKAYEFASTAKEQFGLSELAAKQYSGTMMAMLNSTGVAQDAAAEMSTTLAGLAGDLASFYNISTDEAFMKLRSAIAGETEPMRQLGVNMTVAALQSYALSQGITKSWQSMTQAEQAMLRYNYIMSATSQQQGDYQRTVGSFANQWRLLTLNVQQFAATIGQGFIAAVLPAIQALNALMSVLQRAAEAFRDFMYVLTGYDGKGSQSGIVSELQGMEGASSGLEDVSGSMDDTTDSAKKLKKALSVLPFDQLNQLTDNTQDAGGGGGTGGDDINVPGSGIGNVDSIYDALGSNKLPNAINEWAERIRKAFIEHDWNDLGYQIAWGINQGMQAIYDAINWNNVGPKITAFTSAFTQTFNSLVDNIDFDLMGRTVGAGINTIVNSINQLADGIDWVNLGRRISDGFDGLFDEVDWYNLGHLIGNKFRIAWDIFGGFVQGLNFEQIGTSVAQGLNGVFSTISFGNIAGYLATALNGAFTSLASFAEEFEWNDLVDNIVNGITTFIETFEWEENAEKLNTFLSNLLGALKRLAKEIPWEELGEKIGEFIAEIEWKDILFDIGTIITSTLSGLFTGLETSGFAGSVAAWLLRAFLLVKVSRPVLGLINNISSFLTGSTISSKLFSAFKGIDWIGALKFGLSFSPEAFIPAITKLLDPLMAQLNSEIENSKWADVWDVLERAFAGGLVGVAIGAWFGPAGMIVGGIVGAIGMALTKVDWGDIWNDITGFLSDAANDIFEQTFEFKDAAGESFSNAADSLKDGNLLEAGKNIVLGLGYGISTAVSFLTAPINALFEAIFNGICDLFGIHSPSTVMAEVGVYIVQGLINGIDSLIKDAGNAFKKFLESINEIFSSVPQYFKNTFKKSVENIEYAFSSVDDWFSTKWSEVKKVFEPSANWFKQKFQNAYDNVTKIWNPVNSWFQSKWTQIKNVFSPSVVDSFKTWFRTAYTNTQNIWNPANQWFRSKWDSIKKVFSPSVVDSFRNWFQNAYTNTKNIWNPANDWFRSKWEQIKNVFSPSVVNSFRNWFQSAYSNVQSIWSGVSSWFQGRWDSVRGVFSNVSGFFRYGFQSAYDAVKNIWSGLGRFFKGVAENAFSPIKKLVNGVISGVNWVLKAVGSKTRLGGWGGIHFAKGSDGLQRDTLGIVNDQKGATYKELIVPPNGKPFIPKGRNVMLPLQKGTKIMPADETKLFMSSFSKLPRFEGGIGDFFGSAWNAVKNFTGEVWDYITHPGDIVKIAIDKFADISGLFEPWLSVAGGMVNTALGGITDFVSRIFEDATPKINYNPSAGVEQWRSLAAKALRMEGQYSPSNLNLMLFQMQTESSGNPNAINNWDINAKRGTPSKGLMQVIDPTFRAYARPGYNSNIWDPLSNMLASIRYTVRRYGSLARGWRGHGYAEGIGTITLSDLMGGIPFLAKGGLITSPTLAFTGENFRKEAVLPLENRRTMGMIADSIVSNSSGGLGLSKAEIQQAVAEGVVMAMMNNQGNQPNITVYAELKTENDEVLARAVTRGQQKIDYRNNPTIKFGY